MVDTVRIKSKQGGLNGASVVIMRSSLKVPAEMILVKDIL